MTTNTEAHTIEPMATQWRVRYERNDRPGTTITIRTMTDPKAVVNAYNGHLKNPSTARVWVEARTVSEWTRALESVTNSEREMAVTDTQVA